VTPAAHPLTRRIDGFVVPTAGQWTIDPAHTSADFVARHLMVTKVRGSFGAVTGTIDVAEDPHDSQVEVTIETASVSTGAGDRDAHIKSADFLDVENYPEIRFVATQVKPNRGSFRLTGDLTIKDVTKPVTIDFEFHGIVDDPWGNPKAAFSGTTDIMREDWGLTWNVALDSGGVLVSKKISIEIEAQAAPAQ